MEISSIGELLHWSYANLAMAHQAVTSGAKKHGRTQYMVRARLYKGLRAQRLSIGPLADDERLKMVLPQACCYCGSSNDLTVDHLIPTKRGGANAGDNLVWACRSCNSSKGARDALESSSAWATSSRSKGSRWACRCQLTQNVKAASFLS